MTPTAVHAGKGFLVTKSRWIGHCVNVLSEVHMVGVHRDDVVPARARCIKNLPDLLIRSTHLGAGSVRSRLGASASSDEQQIADLDRGGKARLSVPLEVCAPRVRLDRPSIDHGSVYTWPGTAANGPLVLAASGGPSADTCTFAKSDRRDG